MILYRISTRVQQAVQQEKVELPLRYGDDLKPRRRRIFIEKEIPADDDKCGLVQQLQYDTGTAVVVHEAHWCVLAFLFAIGCQKS